MLPYTDMITVVYYSNRYTTRNTIVPLTRTEFTIPIKAVAATCGQLYEDLTKSHWITLYSYYATIPAYIIQSLFATNDR